MEVRNIPVPRLMLTPHYGGLIIEGFDLNTKRLSRYATGASVLEERLQGSEEKDLFGNIQQGARETELTRVSSLGEGRKQSPENTIIAALTDYPLVDYESEQKELLLKLAKQAVTYYRSFVGDDKTVKMMVENNFRQIAGKYTIRYWSVENMCPMVILSLKFVSQNQPLKGIDLRKFQGTESYFRIAS